MKKIELSEQENNLLRDALESYYIDYIRGPESKDGNRLLHKIEKVIMIKWGE